MKNTKSDNGKLMESKDLALHFMDTLVGVARESFLILDANLQVLSANPVFYQTFQVSQEETENKFVYDLGNGQWDIPELKKLLEQILPQEKTVKDYEVEHVFEKIGKKTMLLNARQIDSVELIVIAIEDITSKKQLESKLVEYTKQLEIKVAERTQELENKLKELEALNKTMVGREIKMTELKAEIERLKKLSKNGNGKSNGNHNGNGNHKNGL